jgi:hypothetical protein
MAQLHKDSAPGAWHKDCTGEAFMKNMEEQERDFAELQKVSDAATLNKPIGFIMSFGVADGGAHYRIMKVKPFVLQHIPFMDGYAIPRAHLRGLAFKDVEVLMKQRALGRVAARRIA